MSVMMIVRWKDRGRGGKDAITEAAGKVKKLFESAGAVRFEFGPVFTGPGMGEYMNTIVFKDWASFQSTFEKVTTSPDYHHIMEPIFHNYERLERNFVQLTVA